MLSRVPRGEADGDQRAQTGDDCREDLARRSGGDQQNNGPGRHECEGEENRHSRVQQDGTDDGHEAERPTGSGQGRSSDPLARGSLGHKRSRGEQPGGDEAEEADLNQVGDAIPDQCDETDSRQDDQECCGARQQITTNIALGTDTVPGAGGAGRELRLMMRLMSIGGTSICAVRAVGPRLRSAGVSGLGPGLRRGDRPLQCWRNGWWNGGRNSGLRGNGRWPADGLRLIGDLGGRLLRGRVLRALIDRRCGVLPGCLRRFSRNRLGVRPGIGRRSRRWGLGGLDHPLRDPVDLALHEIEATQNLLKLAAERRAGAGIIGG